MKKWSDVRKERLDDEQLARVDARVREELLELTLQELRKARALTQNEVATILDVSQPELSRLENSPNPLLSTIRRFVEALGGELEVTAHFPDGETVRITGM